MSTPHVMHDTPEDGRIRISLILLAAAALVLGLLPGMASAATAGGETTTLKEDPALLAGNNNCRGDATYELRVEPPSSGTYTDSATGFSVTLTVYNTPGGQAFDFTTDGGAVSDVYVKGGDYTNWYDYNSHDDTDGDDPADGFLATGDTFLHGAVNDVNGRFYGLSHISFCYELVVPDIIELKKVDENGDPLAGATMQLWKDAVDTGTLVGECTTGTDGVGDCSFTIDENGTYVGHEEAAPANYACCAADQSVEVTLDTTQDTITLTFTDSPALGDVDITKTDDAGNPMVGITFELTGTSNLGTTYATGDKTCTTGASGTCTIEDVEYGTYTVDETNLPDDHAADPDLPASVTIDSSNTTVSLSFENTRLFTKIVLVCQGDDLYASSVTEDGTTTLVSLSSAPSGFTEADLCALGGARFEDNLVGSYDFDVVIGTSEASSGS